MKSILIKASVTVPFAAISAYFSGIALPLAVMTAAITADYITGVIKAYIGGTLSSRVGITGIIKKLCYIFAVLVGAAADLLISFTDIGGVPQCVACLVAVWLTVNELISILENLADIGVPLPTFLKKIIERLQPSADNK